MLGIGLSHKIVIEDMYGYSFDRPARHILIQEAAYRSIPKSLRAELHHRYANWVEGLNGDWLISRQRYFGVPAVGVRSAASGPMINRSNASTTNVYGRLSAIRTSAIM